MKVEASCTLALLVLCLLSTVRYSEHLQLLPALGLVETLEVDLLFFALFYTCAAFHIQGINIFITLFVAHSL